MVNLLKDNYASVFDFVTDPDQQNTNGGVALWEIPPTYSTIFNPILFTRSQWLIMTETTQPSGVKSNYIRIDDDGRGVTLDFAVNTNISVAYKDQNNISRAIGILAGATSATLSDSTLPNVIITTLTSFAREYNGIYSSSYVELKYGNYIIAIQGHAIQTDTLLTTPEGNTLFLNTSVQSATLDVFPKKSGVQSATLTGESYNGITIFDVSPVLRAWLNTELAEIDVEDGVEADGALYVAYRIDGIAGAGISMNFVAINAVAQIGESSDMTPYVGKVLTTKPRLVFYNGYPLDYSVLSGAEGETTPNGEAPANTVTRCAIVAILTDENNEPILTEAGEYIYVIPEANIEVLEACTPHSPFYVRWTNDLGGVDYWMFRNRQMRNIGAQSVDNARIYVTNPQNAYTNIRTIGLDTENGITVGAGSLSAEEFEALRKLPFARIIEWWNEKSQRWIRLAIEDFALDYSHTAGTHSIEITFALPEIITQQQIW